MASLATRIKGNVFRVDFGASPVALQTPGLHAPGSPTSLGCCCFLTRGHPPSHPALHPQDRARGHLLQEVFSASRTLPCSLSTVSGPLCRHWPVSHSRQRAARRQRLSLAHLWIPAASHKGSALMAVGQDRINWIGLLKIGKWAQPQDRNWLCKFSQPIFIEQLLCAQSGFLVVSNINNSGKRTWKNYWRDVEQQ